MAMTRGRGTVSYPGSSPGRASISLVPAVDCGNRLFKIGRQTGPMTASTAISCPKCRAGMVHVAAMPHPIVPGMQRNTFVCYACNQTRTYMLPASETPATAN